MIEFLYMILALLIFLVIILAVVFVVIRKNEKQKNERVINAEDEQTMTAQTTAVAKTATTKLVKEYETKSIFDFMEFDSVRDNMIIQKGGKRFLMAVECHGINYDLMSEVEKTSIEQGFSTFLNTLTEPIQIYIQTRTINLENNIQGYNKRLDSIRDELNIKEHRLKEYMENVNSNEKIIKDKQFEVTREKNLYSYGKDIVEDTKKMSLNKNVLKKKYYVILKYFYEPTDGVDDGATEAEIADIAFSNLYTKAMSIISALSGIGVVGKTLDSYGLVELLYNAYNRDDSEVFGIGKAIEAGYNEIYIDSQNVIDKKIEALNREIQLRSQQKAENAVKEVLDKRSEELKDIEENIESIIEELAKQIIEREENIPQKVKEEAIEKIENKKEEEVADGKQKTKEPNRKRRAS